MTSLRRRSLRQLSRRRPIPQPFDLGLPGLRGPSRSRRRSACSRSKPSPTPEVVVADDSYVEVANDEYYNAFPGTRQAGRRHPRSPCTERESSTYGDRGYIVSKRSTDGGQTWSDEMVVVDNPNLDLRDPNIALLSGGALIVNYFQYGQELTRHGAERPQGRPLSRRRRDLGRTRAGRHGLVRSHLRAGPASFRTATILLAYYGSHEGLQVRDGVCQSLGRRRELVARRDSHRQRARLWQAVPGAEPPPPRERRRPGHHPLRRRTPGHPHERQQGRGQKRGPSPGRRSRGQAPPARREARLGRHHHDLPRRRSGATSACRPSACRATGARRGPPTWARRRSTGKTAT